MITKSFSKFDKVIRGIAEYFLNYIIDSELAVEIACCCFLDPRAFITLGDRKD